MEGTRAALVGGPAPARVPRWQRAGYALLGWHRSLVAASRLAAVGQRAGLVPRRLVPARLPIRQGRLEPTGDDVWLFTGCVMDAWQRHVHAAAIGVLAAAGIGTALPDRRAACCGALHIHAGLRSDAAHLAERTMAAFPGRAPILVDSAGCGAALRGYGELLGTPAAMAFSARVRDVHGALAELALPPPVQVVDERVAIQDPCHLRHVQRDHLAVRTVLAPYVREVVELDDDGLCCGAGGAYAALQPDLAGRIRDRKVAAVLRSGATVVASANPGCSLHLAGPLADGGIRVVHPVQLVHQALGHDRVR